MCYREAVTKGSVHTSVVEAELPHKQVNYPDIRFWNKGDWSRLRRISVGKTDPRAGGSKWNPLGFLEHEDGTPVTSEEETEVRKLARIVFRTIDKSTVFAPPLTWDHGASGQHRQAFRDELERKFEYLKYCSHHWKVEQLAIELYPHYRQVHSYPEQWAEKAHPVGGGTSVTIEVDVDMHPPSKELHGSRMRLVKKRPGSESAASPMTRRAKKMKPDLVIHDPL